MNICLVSGTNRDGNNSIHVATELAEAYRATDADVTLLDLRELPSELLSPQAYANKPAAFGRFADAVVNCNGLALVVPEYNGSFPGVVKLFIDMLPYPEAFENRAVAFTGLSAGRWGSLRSVEQLEMVFGYRNAYLYPGRVFLPNISKVLDEAGAVADEAIRARLAKQAQGFVDFCQKLDS